jgi:hypothetical protein
MIWRVLEIYCDSCHVFRAGIGPNRSYLSWSCLVCLPLCWRTLIFCPLCPNCLRSYSTASGIRVYPSMPDSPYELLFASIKVHLRCVSASGVTHLFCRLRILSGGWGESETWYYLQLFSVLTVYTSLFLSFLAIFQVMQAVWGHHVALERRRDWASFLLQSQLIALAPSFLLFSHLLLLFRCQLMFDYLQFLFHLNSVLFRRSLSHLKSVL